MSSSIEHVLLSIMLRSDQ